MDLRFSRRWRFLLWPSGLWKCTRLPDSTASQPTGWHLTCKQWSPRCYLNTNVFNSFMNVSWQSQRMFEDKRMLFRNIDNSVANSALHQNYILPFLILGVGGKWMDAIYSRKRNSSLFTRLYEYHNFLSRHHLHLHITTNPITITATSNAYGYTLLNQLRSRRQKCYFQKLSHMYWDYCRSKWEFHIPRRYIRVTNWT
jgi:hypothetical protein